MVQLIAFHCSEPAAQPFQTAELHVACCANIVFVHVNAVLFTGSEFVEWVVCGGVEQFRGTKCISQYPSWTDRKLTSGNKTYIIYLQKAAKVFIPAFRQQIRVLFIYIRFIRCVYQVLKEKLYDTIYMTVNVCNRHEE